MQKPPIPADEPARLAALHQLGLLDAPPDARLDHLVSMAAALANAPMAALTLIDAHRQVISASLGLNDRQDQPRDTAFCSHVVGCGRAVIVPDMLLDPRFHDYPQVRDDPLLRFYAGYPLRGQGGHVYGALCVLDTIARHLSPQQTLALDHLAQTTACWLEQECCS